MNNLQSIAEFSKIPPNIMGVVIMKNGNVISLRSRQKCWICGERLRHIDKAVCCPNHPKVVAKTIELYFRFKGEKFFEYGFTSYEEAEERAQELKVAIKNKTFKPELHVSTGVKRKYQTETVITDYIEARKKTVSWDGADENGISPQTFTKIKSHLLEFQAWCKANNHHDIRAIKSWEVKQYLESLTNKAKTKKNKLANIKKFFADIREDSCGELVPDMPIFKKITAKAPEIKTVDLEIREKILAEIPEEHKPIFTFWADNPIRPGELRAIKRDAIVLDDTPHIHIKRAFSGSHFRELTKTKHDWYLALTDKSVQILQQLIPSLKTEFIFYWGDDHRPYKEKYFRKIWNTACDNAGVDRVEPYRSNRHSKVTEWYSQGMPLKDISEILGHSFSSTTEKHYIAKGEKAIKRLHRARRMVK